MSKRLAIAGSRNFPRLDLVHQLVNRLQPTTTVVTGGAAGVDQAALAAARARGLAAEVYWPNWAQLGQRAGLERNLAMLASVDGLVAFWDGKSKGTLHAIGIARKFHLWLKVVEAYSLFTDIAITEEAAE